MQFAHSKSILASLLLLVALGAALVKPAQAEPTVTIPTLLIDSTPSPLTFHGNGYASIPSGESYDYNVYTSLLIWDATDSLVLTHYGPSSPVTLDHTKLGGDHTDSTELLMDYTPSPVLPAGSYSGEFIVEAAEQRPLLAGEPLIKDNAVIFTFSVDSSGAPISLTSQATQPLTLSPESLSLTTKNSPGKLQFKIPGALGEPYGNGDLLKLGNFHPGGVSLAEFSNDTPFYEGMSYHAHDAASAVEVRMARDWESTFISASSS